MSSDPARLRGLALHLGPGEDVRQAIVDALAENVLIDAFVSAHGTLQEIELRDFEQRRTFATPSRIVSFDGRTSLSDGEVTLHMTATVVRPSPRGPEFGMGDVVRATALDLQILVTALVPSQPDTHVHPEVEDRSRSSEQSTESNDPPIDHEPKPRSARVPEVVRRGRRDLDQPGEEEPSPPPASTPEASSWAAVAAASHDAQRAEPRSAARGPSNFFEVQRERERAKSSGLGRSTTGAPVRADARPKSNVREPPRGPSAENPLGTPVHVPAPPARKAYDDTPYPEEGDLVEHFAFGRCEVMRSDGDELVIRDPQSGRAMSLRLGVLQISPAVVEDGRTVYRLRRRTGG